MDDLESVLVFDVALVDSIALLERDFFTSGLPAAVLLVILEMISNALFVVICFVVNVGTMFWGTVIPCPEGEDELKTDVCDIFVRRVACEECGGASEGTLGIFGRSCNCTRLVCCILLVLTDTFPPLVSLVSRLTLGIV